MSVERKGQTRKQCSWASREITFIAKSEIGAVRITCIQQIIDTQRGLQIIAQIDAASERKYVVSRIGLRIAGIGEIFSHMGPAQIAAKCVFVISQREIGQLSSSDWPQSLHGGSFHSPH